MILKLVIIIAISTFGIWLLKARNTSRVRAWQKLIILLFVFAVVGVTLSQRLSTEIASIFGLNRATDVIVYATIILLLFISANIYLKFQDLQAQMVKVARSVTIQDGLKNYPNWGKDA